MTKQRIPKSKQNLVSNKILITFNVKYTLTRLMLLLNSLSNSLCFVLHEHINNITVIQRRNKGTKSSWDFLVNKRNFRKMQDSMSFVFRGNASRLHLPHPKD